MLYEIECWTVKNQHKNRISVSKMRILFWICGMTTWDTIRNGLIKKRVGVAPTIENVVKNRIYDLGYVGAFVARS